MIDSFIWIFLFIRFKFNYLFTLYYIIIYDPTIWAYSIIILNLFSFITLLTIINYILINIIRIGFNIIVYSFNNLSFFNINFLFIIKFIKIIKNIHL